MSWPARIVKSRYAYDALMASVLIGPRRIEIVDAQVGGALDHDWTGGNHAIESHRVTLKLGWLR